MAVTRTYTYLGALETGPGDLKLALGKYSIEAGDSYDRDARPTLVFPMFSNVEKVLAMFCDCIANTALQMALVSLSGRTVTFACLEGGASGAIFPEKTDDEVYGQAFNFYVLVAGH